MRSEEIKPGDELHSEFGALIYTVETVKVAPPHVIATVRFTDGGQGERMWEIGKDTPLVRP